VTNVSGTGHHRERPLAWKSCQALARVATTLMFDLKVYGTRNVPRRGAALIDSNHQSALDSVLLAVRLDRPLNYMSKSQLFEGRKGGSLLRSVFNAFPVRHGTGDVGAVKETILAYARTCGISSRINSRTRIGCSPLLQAICR
jgi:1-acyl-sn-glycerol-3-phosphate acyltransferase